MNKRFLILISILVAAGGLAWLGFYWYNEHHNTLPPVSENELATHLARQHPDAPGQPAVVSVPPLDPKHPVRLAMGALGFPDDQQNRLLGELLTAELSGAKGLELVERQSLDKALRELELNLSGLLRAKEAVRVGKLLRAEWFLLGTVGKKSGTNPIVVARIVDARTGIMRDVGVFSNSKGPSVLAKELGGFVRDCRQGASAPKPRVFLAVGGLTDVGVNHRQADFPQQLRAYLTTAYQGSQLTMLEREYVNTLVDEVRLDLAGLTDDANANPPPPMQSAFWVVDGFYQSFESASYEVEVVFNVSRIFGGRSAHTLRGPPDEAFFRKVKDTIDTTIAKASPLMLAPTKHSESRHELDRGKELFKTGSGQDPIQIVAGLFPVGAGEPDRDRRSRILKDACHSFETVLLLEPDNGEAKLYLSACYRDWGLGRSDEGAQLLKEIAGSPKQDEWSQKARAALGSHYSNFDPAESVRWYKEAVNHSVTAKERSGWQFQVDQASVYAAQHELASTRGATTNSEARSIVESQLFSAIESAEGVYRGKSGGLDCTFGMENFVRSFGRNNWQAGIDRVTTLLPKLNERFPSMQPHILIGLLGVIVDTNSAIIADARKSFAEAAKHPESVLGRANYFESFECAYYRCYRKALFAVCAELMEAKRLASIEARDVAFGERDKVRLAFAYMALARWNDALAILEDLGENGIVMQADGPWVDAWKPYLPARSAALCREKLGLPEPVKADRFTMDKPCLCLHDTSAIGVTPEALWVAINGELVQTDFELHTNKQTRLPISPGAGIPVLCIGPQHIWIGTAGDGLVQYEKASGLCKVLTEKDGLLMNDISSLCLQDKTLWIGFGREGGGGLGKLDLPTGKISSFTPALSADPLSSARSEDREGPPRHSVYSITMGPADDLWMVIRNRGLSRYRPAQNSWETPFGNLNCFGIIGKDMIGAFVLPSGQFTYRTELRRRAMSDKSWENLGGDASLPSSAGLLVINGSDLWLGGLGYIAAYDLPSRKVRRICSIPAKSVDQIEFGGGYLWAKFENHLYRTALSNVR
jgi:hypothetical protein